MTTSTVPRFRHRRWVTTRDYGFLGVVALLAISTQWFTINISPSVPVGLYRFVAIDAPLQRGDLLHLPAVRFGHSWFYRKFIPLLKPVAGLPGDLVCVQPEGLWVQAEPYGAVYQEHRGSQSLCSGAVMSWEQGRSSWRLMRIKVWMGAILA